MKDNFQWINEGAGMPEIDFAKVEDWIRRVADAHGRICGPLTYIFCDDNKMLEVNRQFLSHDYFTDIITFDYSRGKLISGDMFISLDTVRSNAELRRRIAQGDCSWCAAPLWYKRQRPG